MIKILDFEIKNDLQIEFNFSNGEQGLFDAQHYVSSRQGILLDALRNDAYFKRCFIDAGALCWPNGLELSAARVLELCKKVQLA